MTPLSERVGIWSNVCVQPTMAYYAAGIVEWERRRGLVGIFVWDLLRDPVVRNLGAFPPMRISGRVGNRFRMGTAESNGEATHTMGGGGVGNSCMKMNGTAADVEKAEKGLLTLRLQDGVLTMN